MVERSANILGKYGIHARPAAAICTAAKMFPDTKIIILDPNKMNEGVDAKSILTILTVNKKCGDLLIVRAYGRDEEKAAEAVAKVIREFEVLD